MPECRATANNLSLQSFEQLHPRCVAVVVDPIQSVKGKVVIDAFRLIDPKGISARSALTVLET